MKPGKQVSRIEKGESASGGSLAPIAIFAYNRPDHLRKTLDSLSENSEARQSNITIFCDGAKGADDVWATEETRNVAMLARGFGSVTVVSRPVNLGLERSITSGISEILRNFDRVIVFEDDLVTSKYCLNYLNRALDQYAGESAVAAIGCYVFPVAAELPESFFLRVMDCFGWGTWRNRWESYETDPQVLLDEIELDGRSAEFDLEGAYPYTSMLRDCVKNKNASWAVRWYASQFLKGRLCLYPGKSMTKNIGMDGTGVHSGHTRAYEVDLAASPVISFPDAVEENQAAAMATAEYLRAIVADNERLLPRIFRRLIRFRKKTMQVA